MRTCLCRRVFCHPCAAACVNGCRRYIGQPEDSWSNLQNGFSCAQHHANFVWQSSLGQGFFLSATDYDTFDSLSNQNRTWKTDTPSTSSHVIAIYHDTGGDKENQQKRIFSFSYVEMSTFVASWMLNACGCLWRFDLFVSVLIEPEQRDDFQWFPDFAGLEVTCQNLPLMILPLNNLAAWAVWVQGP